MDIVFEWDADKAISNLKKHQVSFEEAQSVFQDPNALLIADPDHSIEEDRFILLGISKETKILVVCHCIVAMMKLYGLFQQEKQQSPNQNNMKGVYMRDEYDFSNAIKNPYVAKNKQQITIRLDQQIIDYFKNMSEETGMPYQNIINYYLLQCVKEEKQMVIQFQN